MSGAPTMTPRLRSDRVRRRAATVEGGGAGLRLRACVALAAAVALSMALSPLLRSPLVSARDTHDRTDAAASAIVRTQTARAATAPSASGLLLLNEAHLRDVKARLQRGDETLTPALAALEGAAAKALATPSASVMDKGVTPPSGDKHDYMSQAPYWWPDPAKPDGRPYLRRDGERNPEINRISDHDALGRLTGVVATLGLAYHLTGRADYAAHAARLTRVWFLDPATRMHPHLTFGQGIPGVTEGRGIGIIETRALPDLLDGILLLGDAPVWTAADRDGLRTWMRAYLAWLTDSTHGQEEAKNGNNHETWYDVQVASLALFTGQEAIARRTLERSRDRIAQQIEPDGRQPRELERTRGWDYSAFNLTAFFHLATLGTRTGVDLWGHRTADGRSLRQALDYLVPFAAGERPWTGAQITGFSPRAIHELLRRAAAAWHEPKYAALADRIAGGNGKAGTVLALTLGLLAAAPHAHAAGADPDKEGWGRFRGPNGTGVSAATNLPTDFGPEKHVLWKTPLPPGHSSPVLTATRIFVTAHTAEKDGYKLLVIALDRKSGQQLWLREVPRQQTGRRENVNGPASPSPVTDGTNVYAFFQEFGLVSFTAEGKERWRLPLGPFNMFYGFGASPILVDRTLVLAVDQDNGAYLLAVDANSGRQRWKTARPHVTSGYSTPTVYRPARGGAQLIVPESFQLTAYAVEDGRKVWWVRGLACEMKSVASLDGDTIYINGWGFSQNQPGRQVATVPFAQGLAKYDKNGDQLVATEEVSGTEPMDRMLGKSVFPAFDLNRDGKLNAQEWDVFRAMLASENGLLAIRLGGEGDMTDRAILWKYQRPVPQVPSTLLYQGVLFMVNDSGILIAFDPKSGAVLKEGRLKGAIDKYFASPIGADGKVWLVSQDGTVSVVTARGDWEILFVNPLGDEVFATPVPADGQLFIRTHGALYAFGAPKS